MQIGLLRAAWALLSLVAYHSNSSYPDGRAPLVAGQPETRQYKGRFRNDDLPVGDWSDIVQVTARP